MLGQIFHGIAAMGVHLDSGEEYSSQVLRKRKDDCEQRVHFLPKFFIFRIHYHSNVPGHLSRFSFYLFSWETIPCTNNAQSYVCIWQEFPQLSVELQQLPAADAPSPS